MFCGTDRTNHFETLLPVHGLSRGFLNSKKQTLSNNDSRPSSIDNWWLRLLSCKDSLLTNSYNTDKPEQDIEKWHVKHKTCPILDFKFWLIALSFSWPEFWISSCHDWLNFNVWSLLTLALIWISNFDDYLSLGPNLDFKFCWWLTLLLLRPDFGFQVAMIGWLTSHSQSCPNSCSCDDDSDWPLSVSLKSLGPKFGFQVWWLDWLTLFHSLGPNLELQVLMIESLSLGPNLETQILINFDDWLSFFSLGPIVSSSRVTSSLDDWWTLFLLARF